MTPAELGAIITACGISLPPTMPVERVLAHAIVESGARFDVVHPVNRNGTRDYGFMGINQIHFARFGVNERTVVERCNNLRIGITILMEADAHAACAYNTGRLNCTNGYDLRITRAAASIQRTSPPQAVASATPPARPRVVALGQGEDGQGFSYSVTR